MTQKTYTSHGFCILNREGDVWTAEVFRSRWAAQRYIDGAKKTNPTWSLTKHTVVPAKITITPKRNEP